MRRYRAERGRRAAPAASGGRRIQFRVGAVLTVFAAVIFVLGIVFTDKARETPATGAAGLAAANSEPLTIEATGQQWLWRYDYPNGAFSYYKLVVPVDTAVELELVSTDVVHTWNVPDLAGKRDAVPGKVNTVFFSADDEGTFDGQSATLSGQAYAAMRTEVEVVSPEEYEDFVEAAEERHRGCPGTGRRPDRKRGSAMSEPQPRPSSSSTASRGARPRWIQLATSADHKDVGRILIAGALGFLFIAVLELLLMRLQLAIPENTFLTPVTFNRMLSLYGTTAIFFFAIPLVLGLFYYVAPLQIGARGTALPRLGQIGAGALGRRRHRSLRRLPLHPLGGRRQPARAALRAGLPLQQRRRRLGRRRRAGDARLRPDRDRPDRRRCAGCARRAWPGGGCRSSPGPAAVGSWLMLVIGPVLLAAITMLLIDRNFDGIFFADGSGGAPLLWQHLSWIFFTGAYMLVLIFALGAIAEIVPTFAGKPLFNRAATIGSLVARSPSSAPSPGCRTC